MAFQGVDIKVADGRVVLTAPFHPATADLAHKINGKFTRATGWTFDSRDEERVRDLARRIFGHDGTQCPTVTVRMTLDWQDRQERELWIGGRMTVKRWERDKRVTFGDGVIVISGGFPDSGGSMRNPRLQADQDTVLEIRDVPAGHHHLEPDSGYTIEKVEEPAADAPGSAADVEELRSERERLLARVAEIDALLPAPEGIEATTVEAAQVLGVSLRTVQRWAQTGRVEAAKDQSGRWIITITGPAGGDASS